MSTSSETVEDHGEIQPEASVTEDSDIFSAVYLNNDGDESMAHKETQMEELNQGSHRPGILLEKLLGP